MKIFDYEKKEKNVFKHLTFNRLSVEHRSFVNIVFFCMFLYLIHIADPQCTSEIARSCNENNRTCTPKSLNKRQWNKKDQKQANEKEREREKKKEESIAVWLMLSYNSNHFQKYFNKTCLRAFAFLAVIYFFLSFFFTFFKQSNWIEYKNLKNKKTKIKFVLFHLNKMFASSVEPNFNQMLYISSCAFTCFTLFFSVFRQTTTTTTTTTKKENMNWILLYYVYSCTLRNNYLLHLGHK